MFNVFLPVSQSLYRYVLPKSTANLHFFAHFPLLYLLPDRLSYTAHFRLYLPCTTLVSALTIPSLYEAPAASHSLFLPSPPLYQIPPHFASAIPLFPRFDLNTHYAARFGCWRTVPRLIKGLSTKKPLDDIQCNADYRSQPPAVTLFHCFIDYLRCKSLFLAFPCHSLFPPYLLQIPL